MTPRDICIVTGDIVGPIRNGGIGTAYYAMALALAEAGHRVTVLYALGDFCENKTTDFWREEYRRRNIEFVPVPSQPIQGHSALKVSYAVYRWLKDRTFDIVHCHEWRGVGFYTALAKRQGLCLQNSVLCVGAHSPTLWHLEGMNERADGEALEVDFMERESVALADVLWSPSQHMVAWMRREGWTLPRQILRQQYILPASPSTAADRSLTAHVPSEFVFFGRLETRKGLDVFCDALDRLVAAGTDVPGVTFLGKTSSIDGTTTTEYLERRAATWPFKWEVISHLDRAAALEYLGQPGRLAIIPSKIDNLPYTVLECLGSGIPFVAAATGGIPEMIRPVDRRRVLFPLDARACGETLQRVLTEGLAPVPLRMSAKRTLRDWLDWHETARPAPATTDAAASTSLRPFVTVCITHRNRPAFLAAALESLARQDYDAMEVVIVDDGSDQAAALEYLSSLEPELARRRWTLIRQPNRYLGAARNRGIAAARGKYVLFMDDDNLARPHEISTFVQAAERSGADILTCVLEVFQSRSPVPERDAPTHLWPFLGGALAPGLLRNVFGDANAFFRRDVFDRIGGFTEDFGVGCEDWELFARARLHGLRIEVVPEPLVLYRQSPSGMLHSTPVQANRMRALRPYLTLLPAHLRPLVHLAHGDRQNAATPAARLDHVQRAVIFGSGEAGRLAIGLAQRCGWTVPWIVDNNPTTWETTAHGYAVRPPSSLTEDAVDLVIVASLAGKPSISAQLRQMGFAAGTSFVHFLDPIRVGGTTLQLTLS